MVDQAWFLAASISGVICALLALSVIAAGWSRRVPEVAFLGSGLLAVSLFATAYGLSVTSFGGGRPASPLAAAVALPIAVAAPLPLLAPTSPLSRRIAQLWRAWVVSIGAITVAGAAYSIRLSVTPDRFSALALITAGATGTALLVRRQVFLYRVSGQTTSLMTSVAVVSLALSTSIAQLTTPGSGISWVLLALENLSVLTAGTAVIVGYRTGRGAEVLRPVLSSEPLAALEVGMSPEVQCFVAALDRRDSITRDHVVRTSALTLRVAIRAGMPAKQVREVALGALLHDTGKLIVPSDIIKKPGALTDEEFATIKTHPEQGERLLEGSPSLAGAARYVRSHHERNGYPDGLRGDAITLDLGLVSVTDAWDAMTNTRHYRNAMGLEKAKAILRNGAGTQWRPDAVSMLLAEVEENGLFDLDAAGPIGRHEASDVDSCLPDEAQEFCVIDGANCCDDDHDRWDENNHPARRQGEENYSLSAANRFLAQSGPTRYTDPGSSDLVGSELIASD